MLMVRAGTVVDDFIAQLLPHLEEGDIIIDGGNANFPDSTRRTHELAAKGIRFIGAGVSGGEEGARNGPSIMPGGSEEAWPFVKPILQAISAKTPQGEPCCDWVGRDGAGHFVKMVHNGIEYGDMQLICEAYQFMKDGLGMSADEIQQTFAAWNKTELNSYLIEITADILAYKDSDGLPLVDKILDTAGQKGTGKWTGINALDLGIPLTLISEAVFARCVSAFKQQRETAAALFGHTAETVAGDRAEWLEALRLALLASKIISYAQGFMLIREAGEANGWELNYGNTALLWREGCIIRSAFLGNIRDAYEADPDLVFLGSDPYFKKYPANRAAVLAQSGGQGRRMRPAHALYDFRSDFFRRLHHGTPAGQSVAGATRLFRRTHLRTHRQTARRIFPYQLDGYRRRYGFDNL